MADPSDLPAPAKPIRMWVTYCAFKKNGFPSLGSFGSTTGTVVILPLAAWKQLCADIPALAQQQFEVGAEE